MGSRVRWISVAFFLAAGLLLSLRILRTPEDGAGGERPISKSLRLTPPSLDLGEIPVGEFRSASVQVRNDGSATLTITDLDSSCSCLRADLPNRELRPGSVQTLKLQLFGQTGRSTENLSVTLLTDEPGRPRAVLSVSGRSKETYAIVPPKLAFGRVSATAPKTLEARIRRIDGGPVSIRELRVAHPEITLAWEPVAGRESTEFRIIATLKTRSAERIEDLLKIWVAEAEFPVGAIPLSAEGEGEITLMPASVLAIVEQGRQVDYFETELRRSQPGPLFVESVQENAGLHMEFTSERLGEGKCRLRVRFRDPLPPKTAAGDLLIKTNVDDELLRLPYRVERR